ncbi:MAG: hypothetical protein KGI84_08790 [Elusimicrobia bacterium]|nr:hypothetical protein [Elusimicrobiota bacterium]
MNPPPGPAPDQRALDRARRASPAAFKRLAAKDYDHPDVQYWVKASGTLYWAAAILGVACILDTLHQSFSQGLWRPFEPLYYLYFPVLTAYAAARDREKRVRRAQEYEKRMGDLFFWAWIGVVFLIWIRMSMHYAASIPPTLKPTMVIVLGVFAGVKAAAWKWPITPFDPDDPNDPDAPPQPAPTPGPAPLPGPDPSPDPNDVQAQRTKVLSYVQANGKITTAQCEELLGFSDPRPARRLLSEMVDAGLLERFGAERGPNVAYRIPSN